MILLLIFICLQISVGTGLDLRRQIPKVCHLKPADIVFVLDSSDSVNSTNFKTELNFLKTFLNNFEIGPQYAQIGVVTYSSLVHNEIQLSQYSDNSSLKNAIDGIPFYTGSTQTGAAMQLALNRSFTAQSGDRPGVVNMMVVITDGLSNRPNQTREVAKLIHDAGIETIAIGVGNRVSAAELRSIASDDKHVFHVSSFDALFTIERELTDTTCNVTTQHQVSKVCHLKPADIVFVLDSSDSVNSTNFKTELNFLMAFLSNFEIGPQYVQIGVVTYSSLVHNEIQLSQFSDNASLKNAIDGIPFYTGSTQTGAAMQLALNRSFTAQSGDRPGVVNIMIVITDGLSNRPNQTREVAKQIHAAGIETIAIGVGNRVSPTELRSIASDDKHVFHVSSFDALFTIESELTDSTCNVTTQHQDSKVCQDSFKNCKAYGASVCGAYKDWATRNCAKFCGYCRKVPSPSPPPLVTISQHGCTDSLSTCANYGPDMCFKYPNWARQQCAKFCLMCNGNNPFAAGNVVG